METLTLEHSIQARAHDVDVVDSKVLFSTILVERHVLGSGALDGVCVRVLGRPRIDDDIRRHSAVNNPARGRVERVAVRRRGRGRDCERFSGSGMLRVRCEDRFNEFLVLDRSRRLGDSDHWLRRTRDRALRNDQEAGQF